MTVDSRRLGILHLIHVLRSTNSQYNEHSLPVMRERAIALCSYFEPQLDPPPEIRLFAGNGTLLGFIAALRAALSAARYDAIHAHSPQTGFLLLVALVAWRRYRLLQPHTVYTVHDSFYDYKTRNKVLMIPALASFHRVVFCSHAAYESLPAVLKAVVGSRYRIVQNGADIDRIDRVVDSSETENNASFSVISVGRLETVKDPDVAIEAFRTGTGDGTRFVWIGDGSLRPDLESRIARSDLDDRIEMTGQIERDEVFRRYADSDVYLSTSHGEGLPVAAMEAMACGLPVILSDIAPHREFLNNDVEFIPLVPVGDVAGFAREIGRFEAMSESERATVGRQCRRLVETRFSLARMNSGYEAIYRALPHFGDEEATAT